MNSPHLNEFRQTNANGICITSHGIYVLLKTFDDKTVVWLNSKGNIITRTYMFSKMAFPAFNKPMKFQSTRSDFTYETFKL